MEIAFAVLINYERDLDFTNGASITNNVILFAYTIVMALYPVWVFVLLFRKHGDLENSKAIYGSAFMNVRADNKYTIILPIMDLLRRLLLVTVFIYGR